MSKSIPTQAQGDAEGRSDRWLHLVIRQDLAAEKWDLYVDGELAAIDFAMEEMEGWDLFAFNGGKDGATYLDGIGIGSENPLFADRDGDGIPDAYEIAHRLDPNRNDRDEDRDGDGISNIAEYLAGTSPSFAGNGVAGQIIYVDNLMGHDDNSGQVSHRAGTNGPKSSIKAAMAAAQNGAVIVVMPGMGIYNEGSRSAKGKRITIRTVGSIIIK